MYSEESRSEASDEVLCSKCGICPLSIDFPGSEKLCENCNEELIAHNLAQELLSQGFQINKNDTQEGSDIEEPEVGGVESEESKAEGPENVEVKAENPENEEAEVEGPENEELEAEGPENEELEVEGPENEELEVEGPENEELEAEGPENEDPEVEGPENEELEAEGPENEDMSQSGTEVMEDSEASEGDKTDSLDDELAERISKSSDSEEGGPYPPWYENRDDVDLGFEGGDEEGGEDSDEKDSCDELEVPMNDSDMEEVESIPESKSTFGDESSPVSNIDDLDIDMERTLLEKNEIRSWSESPHDDNFEIKEAGSQDEDDGKEKATRVYIREEDESEMSEVSNSDSDSDFSPPVIRRRSSRQTANKYKTSNPNVNINGPVSRRRKAFKKRLPYKSPTEAATTVTTPCLFHRGVFYQVGDIVGVCDAKKRGIFYAQITGLMMDMYANKSCTIQWLLPTKESPDHNVCFDPVTYYLGPAEDFARPLDCFVLVTRVPSDYYKFNKTPYPPVLPPPALSSYVWANLEKIYVKAGSRNDE